jgi:hypothetical protein
MKTTHKQTMPKKAVARRVALLTMTALAAMDQGNLSVDALRETLLSLNLSLLQDTYGMQSAEIRQEMERCVPILQPLFTSTKEQPCYATV